ncbi:winged helix DNA-binding protein [Microbacterium sp. 10M-3C3]|jgi:DNA-binding MarR family transcriptional regulator|uniref:MarR family winged helix-turn-helix transcriptional regulator n=1 Tax=Microbacterium sp. 10M-3C3 TaxID=2483401 RepID=UPI000F63BC3D|nr:winged helix DNA-binding protein [Microbacterium sp. 10M-3C3]
MTDSGKATGSRSLSADDFPYRSELLANLSALILLWDSPALQGEILAKTGESIDQQSHQTLRHLLAWGPMRPTVLSEVLATGASHVSKIVRRLEGDGLVERTTDPTDGRATLIRLTDAGEEAARGVYALGDRMIAEVLEGWSAADIRRYTALTKRFVADAIASADRMLERGLLPAENRTASD